MGIYNSYKHWFQLEKQIKSEKYKSTLISKEPSAIEEEVSIDKE